MIYYWPDFAGIRKSRMYIRALSRGYESPFTRQATFERLAGERWEAEFELAPMAQGAGLTSGQQLRAWLSAVDGQAGKIAVSDPDYAGPYGAISAYVWDDTLEPQLDPAKIWAFGDSTGFGDGTEWVDQPAVAALGAAAAALDESVCLSGLPASVAAAFVSGDVIQVGHEFSGNSQLFQITLGAGTNASGSARLGVRPRVRNAFLAATPVYLLAPKCVMRLTGDDQASPTFDPDQATHAVKLVESI